MTRCEEARDLLLEAPVEALLGGGPSELAAHLRQCDACAEVGQRIVDAQTALSGALADMADAVAVETDPLGARTGEIGPPAGVGMAEEAGDVGPRVLGSPSGAEPAVRKRLRVWRVALPLAAAAVAGLVLLQLPGSTGTGVPFVPPELAQRAAEGNGEMVAATSPETTVAVLPTGNPDITVVWFIR